MDLLVSIAHDFMRAQPRSDRLIRCTQALLSLLETLQGHTPPSANTEADVVDQSLVQIVALVREPASRLSSDQRREFARGIRRLTDSFPEKAFTNLAFVKDRRIQFEQQQQAAPEQLLLFIVHVFTMYTCGFYSLTPDLSPLERHAPWLKGVRIE